VFDGPSSDPHLTRFAKQPLHLIEHRFVLPSSDSGLTSSRALLVKAACQNRKIAHGFPAGKLFRWTLGHKET
jgi:hypothetical protein